MSNLNNLQKQQRGGVALRATFAALIALGNIPGAAAITPNLAHVAFASTTSSHINEITDPYITKMTTAAVYKLPSIGVFLRIQLLANLALIEKPRKREIIMTLFLKKLFPSSSKIFLKNLNNN